jgi:exodeoxyribonuclease VII small subunit
VAKNENSTESKDSPQPTFEQALEKLEQITRQLEEGQLGLSEALVCYEQGVKHLKQCYQALQQAERKIELLAGVDAQGNPITKPFDDEASSLEEKAESRSRRRSRGSSSTAAAKEPERDDMDTPGGLF